MTPTFWLAGKVGRNAAAGLRTQQALADLFRRMGRQLKGGLKAARGLSFSQAESCFCVFAEAPATPEPALRVWCGGRRGGAELAAGRDDVQALGDAGPSLAVGFEVQAGLLAQGLCTATGSHERARTLGISKSQP